MMYEIRVTDIYQETSDIVRLRLDTNVIEEARMVVVALVRGYAWMSAFNLRIVLYRVTGITSREFIYSENVQ
jgi:hypothetical protein